MKNRTITARDIQEVKKAVLQGRIDANLNNEQLFMALAETLEHFIEFPLDNRTKEYKEKRRLTDQAKASLTELAKVLH